MSEPTPKGHQGDDAQAHQEARDYLHNELHIDPQGLTEALQSVYGDSYAAGVLAALSQSDLSNVSSGLNLPHTQEEWDAFWNSWQPGSETSAALVEGSGLSDLLDSAGVTIKGIVGSALSQMGTALADGVRAGDSVDTIAKNLSGLVADPSRAYMIADTETARAMTAGSVQQYRADGVFAVNLLTSPGACPTCLAIAAENPIKLANGIVPVHPRCRCSLAPATKVMVHPTDEIGTVEQSGAADLATVAGVATVAGETEVEAAEAKAIEERHDEEAAALRRQFEQAQLEPSHTVPEPDVVPNPKAYYGENTGGGMELGGENTGGGMTAAEENTGGGTTGMNSNKGGGIGAADENTGAGDEPLTPEPAIEPTTAPAATPTPKPKPKPKPTPKPTLKPKRIRKRTRGGKPVKR